LDFYHTFVYINDFIFSFKNLSGFEVLKINTVAVPAIDKQTHNKLQFPKPPVRLGVKYYMNGFILSLHFANYINFG
jgi:hypothetical protein